MNYKLAGTADTLIHDTEKLLETPNPFSNDPDSEECDCEDCKPSQKPQVVDPQPLVLCKGADGKTYKVISKQHLIPAQTSVPQSNGFDPFDYNKYLACADFSKCSVDSLDQFHMNAIKGLFCVLIGINLIVTFLINDYIAHMFFFYSYWGAFSALFSSCFQIKASKFPKNYQIMAMIFSEMSWSFNVIIMPLFWTVEAPTVFPQLNWHKLHDVIWGVHYCSLHTIPLISCVTNTYLTKNMTFIREDWPIMFVAGLIYIYANWLGTKVEGAPLYPYADWKNVPLTIFLYFLLGCVQTVGYYYISHYINSIRPKKPEANGQMKLVPVVVVQQ